MSSPYTCSASTYDPTNQHIMDCSPILEPHGLQRTQRMVELGLVIIRLPGNPCSPKSRVANHHYRPHIADALVSAGVYRTRSEAFADAVSASYKYYIPHAFADLSWKWWPPSRERAV